MINPDSFTNENNKDHNKKWPYIPDHPYRILIIGGTGSGKTNALLKLINEQYHIDRIYLYAKDLSEPEYEYLIERRENENMRILMIITQGEKEKNLIVFDEMIAIIMTNKRIKAIIKELFIRWRKLNISLVFITQSCFSVPKDVRLNSTHYLIMKINNKRELQNIAINHSADIDYQDFIKIYRECTKEPYNVLTIDTTLPASDPLRFRKNLFESL